MEKRLEHKFQAALDARLNDFAVKLGQPQPIEPAQRPPKPPKLPTLASIVARPKTKPALPQQLEAPLILTPSTNNEANVIDLVTNDLTDITDDGFIKVNRVKKTRKGNLLVVAGSAADKETLRERLLSSTTLSTKYTIRDPKNRNPRLLISDISPLIQDDKELLETIHSRNPAINSAMDLDTFVKSVKIVFHPRDAANGERSIVVEVSPAMRALLINHAPLRAKWQILQVQDYILVTRCYRCNSYGHSTKTCKVPRDKPICSHCASEGHSFKDCPSKNNNAVAKCINCVRHNALPGARQVDTAHGVTSRNCPELRRYKEAVFNSTNYGF